MRCRKSLVLCSSLLDGALLRHVAERAEDDALLAQHRVEVEAEDGKLAVLAPHADVDVLRVLPLAEAQAQIVGERRVFGREEIADLAARAGRSRRSR